MIPSINRTSTLSPSAPSQALAPNKCIKCPEGEKNWPGEHVSYEDAEASLPRTLSTTTLVSLFHFNIELAVLNRLAIYNHSGGHKNERSVII